MQNNTAYARGYARTLKTAGILSGSNENTYGTGGAVSGMATGSVLGGRLGENLARKTRREVMGVPIPFTETVDPNTGQVLGSALGALAGGYLGHQYGTATGRSMDTPRTPTPSYNYGRR